MYVKKEEKLQIIRWYIRKYVRHDKDISAITNGGNGKFMKLPEEKGIVRFALTQ